MKNKEMLRLTGWGFIDAAGTNKPSVLHEVDLNTVPDEKCMGFHKALNNERHRCCNYGNNYGGKCIICVDLYHNGIFCAGGEGSYGGGKDACGGDSGSAIFIKNHKEQKVIQIGLTSGSRITTGCGQAYGYYTRVEHYLKWILDNMDK